MHCSVEIAPNRVMRCPLNYTRLSSFEARFPSRSNFWDSPGGIVHVHPREFLEAEDEGWIAFAMKVREKLWTLTNPLLGSLAFGSTGTLFICLKLLTGMTRDVTR